MWKVVITRVSKVSGFYSNAITLPSKKHEKLEVEKREICFIHKFKPFHSVGQTAESLKRSLVLISSYRLSGNRMRVWISQLSSGSLSIRTRLQHVIVSVCVCV